VLVPVQPTLSLSPAGPAVQPSSSLGFLFLSPQELVAWPYSPSLLSRGTAFWVGIG
jgi:hypothetical protein